MSSTPVRTIHDLHLCLTRRDFLPAAAGGVVGFPIIAGQAKKGSARQEKEEQVSPGEDLMQEHGVLRRVLLVYDHFQQAGGNRPELYAVIHEAATIIREFIQDYHEKQEEDDLFPRFEKAGEMVELVRTLREQHDAGRQLTAQILGLSTSAPRDSSQRDRLVEAVAAFSRMYRPHAAREDTVLYPAFRKLVPGKEMKSLGEKFEQREQKMFGRDGFEKYVARVAELERKLGIYDLSKFTPRISAQAAS